eukprot:3628038-Rhodomonas_salina.1
MKLTCGAERETLESGPSSESTRSSPPTASHTALVSRPSCSLPLALRLLLSHKVLLRAGVDTSPMRPHPLLCSPIQKPAL